MQRQLGWVALGLGGCFGAQQPYDDDHRYYRPDARVSSIDSGEPIDAFVWLDAPIDSRPIDAPPDAPPPCVPLKCSDQGASCGLGLDNGCGMPLDCGMCDAVSTCGGQGVPNVCAIPTTERECANGWCWESPLPFAFTPTGVFARTTSDVWMIGTRGIVKHFDGTSWTAITTNTVADLNGIWMASATDGWIVGDAGTLLRWNGTTWNPVASGTTADLAGVHGRAANNVWFVGDHITKRWNGSSLSTVGTTSYYFNHVFITSSNKVFGTSSAWVYENVNGTWMVRTSDTSGSFSYPYFSGIAGVGSTVYAVGGVSVLAGTDHEWVWKWDGTTWTQIDEPGVGIYHDAYVDGTGIFAPTEADVWNMDTNAMTAGPPGTMNKAAGVAGEIFAPSSQGLPWHYQGGTWTAPPRSNLSQASLYSAGRVGDDLWFGHYGEALEWNHGLIRHDRPDYIDAFSGTGRDDVWALDRDSFFQVSKVDHFDGEHWTQMNGPGVKIAALRATAEEVHVFGEGVFHLAGTTWVAETLPVTATWKAYSDVGDDIFLLGTDTTTSPYTPHLAKRVGGTWSAMTAPATQTVCGIAAISANDIWVTGQDRDPTTFDYSGTISHWDGTTWTTIKPAGITNACPIVASGGEVWVAGTGNGSVLHRAADGTWTTLNGIASGDIRALVVDATGTLWAAGDNGVIMHR
jgi:hypothetical protein